MPQSCREAVIASLENASCYPDCEIRELREALAHRELGETASADQVILGNGASELIYALCQYLLPIDAMVTAPTFMEYETALRINGANVLYFELKREDAYTLSEDILDALTPEIELLFLCNPNNPTGQIMPKDLLLNICRKCEENEIFLCLDECFLPFMEEEEEYSMREYLSEFPHLMILKAFTKIYGMAGIRFGYLLSENTQLLRGIREVMQPWNVSIPAQEAAKAALNEQEFEQETKVLIRNEREYLLGEMEKLGVDVIGHPAANYIFFESEKDLAERFLKKGVLIRTCSNYTGLGEGFFRIGIRTPEENRAFINIWKEIKEEYQHG